MLYIGPDHRENLQHVELMLREGSIDIDKAEAFLKRVIHNEKERLDLLDSVIDRGEKADQHSELCHGQILFSLLRAYNRSH